MSVHILKSAKTDSIRNAHKPAGFEPFEARGDPTGDFWKKVSEAVRFTPCIRIEEWGSNK